MSRFHELVRSTPLTTLFFMVTCISLFVLQALFDWPLHHFTMCPRLVIRNHQYYRMLTSTLFHGGLMHIGMNMMSTFAISPNIEKRMGTLRYMNSILYSILFTSTLYITIAYIASIVFRYHHWVHQHAVGFSGIIFHMSVLECNYNPNQSRSLFGFTTVPAYVYPWALLVVLQFIMPNLSFLGHLVGILTGTAEAHGYFEFVRVHETTLMNLESSYLTRLARMPNFVATPTLPSLGRTLASSSGIVSRITTSVQQGAKLVCQWVGHVAEFIKVFLFGRGHQVGVTGNENGGDRGRTTKQQQRKLPIRPTESAGSDDDMEPLITSADSPQQGKGTTRQDPKANSDCGDNEVASSFV